MATIQAVILGWLAAILLAFLVYAVIRVGDMLAHLFHLARDISKALVRLAASTELQTSLMEEAERKMSLEDAQLDAEVGRLQAEKRLEDLRAKFFSMLMADERHLDENWPNTSNLDWTDYFGKVVVSFLNPASGQKVRVLLHDPESGAGVEIQSCDIVRYVGRHEEHSPGSEAPCSETYDLDELSDAVRLVVEFIGAYPQGYSEEVPSEEQEKLNREFSNLGAPEPGDGDYEAAVDQTLTEMIPPATGDETVRGDIGEETVRFVPQRNPFEPDVKATDNALNGAARIRPLKQHPSFEDGV